MNDNLYYLFWNTLFLSGQGEDGVGLDHTSSCGSRGAQFQNFHHGR